MQKTGMAQETKDGEFDTLALIFEKRSLGTRTMHGDVVKFRDAIAALLHHQESLLVAFQAMVPEIGTSNDLAVVSALLKAMEGGKKAILDEMELVFTDRILKIFQELLTAQQGIDAKITKRNHKLLDYDRHRHAFNKMQEGNQRKMNSISEERKMTKTEQQLHEAEAEFQRYNAQLKEDLPRYFNIHERLMGPCLEALIDFLKMFFAKQNEWMRAVSQLKGTQAMGDHYSAIIQDYDVAMKGVLERISGMRLLSAAFGKVPIKNLLVSRSSTSGKNSPVSPVSPKKKDATEPTKSPIKVAPVVSTPMAKATAPLVKVTPSSPSKPQQQPNFLPKTNSSLSFRANNYGSPPIYSEPESPIKKHATAESPKSPSTAPIYVDVYDLNKEQQDRFAESTKKVVVESKPSSKVADIAAKFGSVSLSSSRQSLPKYSPAAPPVASANRGNPSIVIGLFDFEGGEEGDLPFMAGDRIEVISKTDSQNDWWIGKLNGKTGIFPANYTKAAI